MKAGSGHIHSYIEREIPTYNLVHPVFRHTQKEREREDAKIMGLALEKLAVEHRHKLTDLKVQLREDAKKKREAFKKERVRQKVLIINDSCEKQYTSWVARIEFKSRRPDLAPGTVFCGRDQPNIKGYKL